MRRFSVFLLLVLIITLHVLSSQEQYTIYVVQKGDTLYSIAKQFNTTVDVLLKLNNLSDASKLYVGFKLKIPVLHAQTIQYTVQKGDTLFSIARNRNVSVETLRTLNKLSSDTIKIGQIIRIPVSSTQESVNQKNTTTHQTSQPQNSSPLSGQQQAATPDKGRDWPCEGTVVYLQGNLQGILITAGPRTQVKTVRSGVVVSHGPFRGFGTMIFVRAPDGLIYVYGGIVRSRVKVGDNIEYGAILGETSSEDANDVFFFVFSGNQALDPAKVPRG